MNTQTRTAQRGGKNSKLDSISSSKTQKNDAKSENKSLDPRTQPTAEQMRIAQLISKEEDDTNLKEKVKQVMDATRKTEDDAITALHDSDHDINKAVNMLLEGEAQGEWETSGKKKKNRQPTGAKSNEVANNRTGGEGDGEEGETPVPAANTEREKPRNRGGPPRLRGRGGNDRVSGRGRENKENEQNTEEGFTKNRGEGGFRRGGRGMANGPGSRSGRGGRGGRLGPRTFQSRDKSGGSFPRSIETWNNPVPESSAENNLKMESWGGEFPSPEDWDNEEYTGSLAESKVFTPSGGIEPSIVAPENLQDSSNQEMLMSSATQDYHQASHLPPSPLPVGVGTLNAAQTQYLSQLTAQSENLKSAVGIGSGGSVSYNQSSGGNAYPSSGSSGTTSFSQSASNNSSYGPSSGSAPSAYGQTTGYGQSGQGTYGANAPASSGYGQTSGGYGQTDSSNYGQQSQAGYGQSVGNTSAFQNPSNANTYVQTGSGYGNSASNSSGYQGSTSGNAYPSNTGTGNTYQAAGSGNSYQAAGGTSSSAAGSTSVYTGAGAQGANSYQNSASQRVTYQSNTGSSYPVNAGNVPGGNTTYQGSSASFHSANQPSVFTSQTYNNSGVGSYGSQLSDGPGTDAVQSTQPARTKTQRARVPPPSKIPQSAVEMPEDSINNSISFLDVQFGGLEFGSESGNFESGNSATASSTSDQTTSTATTTDTQTSALDGYSTSNASAVKNNQANLVNALTGKSVLASSEGMSTTEHKTTFNAPSSRVASSNSGLDLTKSDVGLTYSAASSVNYQTYQSQKSNSTGTAVYQQSGYSTGNFSSSTPQVTSSSSSYSTNQSQSNNFSTPSGSNSFPNSSYSQASNPGVVNYPNTSNTYQSANSFPNTNQTYQSSGQSVYGSPLSSGYPSANQYQNSYGVSASSSNQNKMNSGLTSSSKDSQEYAASTTVSSLTSTANSGLTNAALTSAAQTVNTTTTKVSSATTKSSVVANIPPGVPPIMGTHQYIMSQGSMPYFHQAPTMYSFEDIQLLQQRIPHMATGYYDMYQNPTSLPTGRDNLASVAYTMSDARYTRGDNNASPVPSTLSQQTATQAHQQPMMNPSLPPGYAYFYGAAGMMPGSFQYGTPALYPIPATNAHGSTATSQYAKPGSYASTYGSGYEGLSQTQDYQKSAYVSTNQTQSKTGVGVTTGSSGSSTSDLSASMYGKTHTALGKVNDSASSTGPRNQSSAQPNKTGNKQNYNPYWSPSMN
ncbi:UNVERIFIED_CONTAM: hypothetical protein PYX00_000700 [Menopon gallinae]|uniref:Protein lingerer n=1 Tax=Menopon gallinae TaxID=328185 RepID=A0AAW2I9L2_9NEOP